MRIALAAMWSGLATLMQAFGELSAGLLSLCRAGNLMASDYEVELLEERKLKQAEADAKLLALAVPAGKVK